MKILVVKLSSLGDLFHALPAVHMLKTELSASVDWVTTHVYRDVVKCFGDVDRVISFYRHGVLSHLRPFLTELRRDRYDLVVDMQGLLKSAVTARLARAEQVIGPSFQREGARWFYSDVAGAADRGRHAVEQCLDVVRFLGLPVSDPVFPMQVPVRPVEGARPRVALLPVSRWATKNWPAKHWVALIDQLQADGIASLYLLGGPADRPVCADIARQTRCAAVNLAGELSLVEMCGVLQDVDLLIANDSGPVHAAAALGTPCLVLFGPTDPRRTGPYGHAHRVLKRELDCMPCLSRTCRIKTHACLEGLEVTNVAAAARRMLGRTET